MKSVKKEWKQVKSDEELLAWAKKWSGLLLETFNNPIWTSGHTAGKQEVYDKIEKLNKGERPEKLDKPLEAYAKVLDTISSDIAVLNFSITTNSEMLEKMSDEELKQRAAKEISQQLSRFIEIEEEETEQGTKYNFSVALVS